MKGLILKDLYYIRNNFKIIFIMIVFFGAIFIREETITMGIAMISFILANIGVGTITVDEKGNWNKYALTMPLTRKNVVIEKFLFINSLILLFFFLTSIIAFPIFNLLNLEMIITMVILLSILLIITNMQIFIAYKYGGEKTVIYIFGVFGTIAVLGFVLKKLFPNLLKSIINYIDSINLKVLGLSSITFALICVGIFFILTLNTVNNKEF
ncbi:ABC-2 transporter permease [Miniphocaeibacter halophilus]|uniref:ABC-2 transporter permease n=1 Tax=Miniphocaeibacter halophilus TaxID=2931922 RepID=A0AC61MSA5_9FIRM|nr:ABC-2 transporter permease [Miniphocaeibacter halophilus]QQK08497.1 ABC-2 transporter permease [Miniphocaeibacter halophilus]